MSLNDRLQALAEISRFMEYDGPDADDCPTCGNCGEEFTNDIRWYDNARFIYVCTECAEATCSL